MFQHTVARKHDIKKLVHEVSRACGSSILYFVVADEDICRDFKFQTPDPPLHGVAPVKLEEYALWIPVPESIWNKRLFTLVYIWNSIKCVDTLVWKLVLLFLEWDLIKPNVSWPANSSRISSISTSVHLPSIGKEIPFWNYIGVYHFLLSIQD